LIPALSHGGGEQEKKFGGGGGERSFWLLAVGF
jgi:hypothetical protein